MKAILLLRVIHAIKGKQTVSSVSIKKESSMKIGFMSLFFTVLAGCATGPYTPIRESSLKGEKVIYFEQVDRVPKDVLMLLCEKKDDGTMSARVIPWLEFIPMIEKLADVAPEIVASYSEERMANAMITRRMLFRGYGGTNDLVEIERIIKTMGGNIENWSMKK